MTIIEAVRKYLEGCPLLNGGKLNVDFLPEEAATYSVDVVPVKPVVKAYLDGSSKRQFLFVFATRAYYGDHIRQQLDNLCLFEAFEEWVDFAQETRDSICHWFTVEDLKYLFRGGRLSKTSFVAASMLNIKPVLHVDNEGALIPMDKVRGRKKSIKALCDHMDQTAIDQASQTVFISHGDCLEDVETLKSLITQRMGVTNYVVNVLDPVIGAHAGPGTLPLFFIGTQK